MATDDNGVPWQDQKSLDESATYHEQRGGRERYLEEVADVFKAIQGHDFHENRVLRVPCVPSEFPCAIIKSGLLITYKGLNEDKNHLYKILRSNMRYCAWLYCIMVISENQRVVHYAQTQTNCSDKSIV